MGVWTPGPGATSGNDTYTGDQTNEAIAGLEGDDTLNGAGGDDTLRGEGDDTYYVNTSVDVVFEGDAAWGVDIVYAINTSHTLGANVDNLTLSGAGTLTGTGNADANIITGNAGDSVLRGAGGNDVIIGGAGSDTLTGGTGDDLFVFAAGDGAARITDFNAGGVDDVIDLSAYEGTGITWAITQVGADTLFTFSNGDTITLAYVNSTQLVQDDPFHYS